MTDAQTKLVAAAIVFGLGAVASGIGFLAMATDRHIADVGPVPGVIAMAVGGFLGLYALIRMKNQQ